MDVFCNVNVVNSPSGQIPPIGSGGLVWEALQKGLQDMCWNDSNVPRPICSGGFKMFVAVSTTVIALKSLCVCKCEIPKCEVTRTLFSLCNGKNEASYCSNFTCGNMLDQILPSTAVQVNGNTEGILGNQTLARQMMIRTQKFWKTAGLWQFPAEIIELQNSGLA